MQSRGLENQAALRSFTRALETAAIAVLAAIEGAKLREHRLRDPVAAMATVERGLALADRRRARGLPELALEADLRHRWRRLRIRLAARQASASSAVRTGPASATSVGRSNGAGQSNITALSPASR